MDDRYALPCAYLEGVSTYLQPREVEEPMRIKPWWKIKEDYRTLKRRIKVMKLVYEGKPVIYSAYIEYGTGLDLTYLNMYECSIFGGDPNVRPSVSGRPGKNG